jgi:uncharacterized repeat protein (TIGR01451 family)
MRRLSTALCSIAAALLALPGAAQTSGCGENPPSTGNKTLSGGKTYYLDVPSGYDEDTPMPVLFGFHGTDPGTFGVEVNGELFCGRPFGSFAGYLYSGFRNSGAVGNDAILVCPDSETGLSEGGSFADWDAADFDALLAEVEADLCVDTSRVFAAGHSAGASFVNELGCERGSVLRGIGVVAPVFSSSPCGSPSGQVAAMVLEGEADTLSAGPDSRDFWAGQSGCDTGTPLPISPSACARDGNDTHETYAGCDADYPVEYCEWDGLDHFEPWNFPAIVTFIDGQDVAGPALWAFFESLGPVATGADLEITKTDGLTSVAPGGGVTYTIVASNNGPEAVTDADVTDTLPSALTSCTYESVASSGASGNTASGSDDIADTLSLDSGASVTYTVDCTVQAAATGTLSNTASIDSATVADPVSGNDSATDSDTVIRSADLGITKTDGVTVADPGGSLTYMIVATNNGPVAVPDVAVSDTFPGDLSCSWTSVAGGGATGNSSTSGSSLSDTLSMPSGSSVTYTVTCSISTSATGTLSNTATIDSPTFADLTASNDSATDGDTQLRLANLGITKTDEVTVADPGGSVVYTITASNAGPSAVTDAAVSDTFPVALESCSWTSVAAGGATGNTESSGSGLAETLSLPAGSSVTYSVACTVASSATGTLSNTASIASPTVFDPTSGNDSATDADTAIRLADLEITKTDGATYVTPGGEVVYTIVASNAGPTEVPDAAVDDTFSADLEDCTWTSVAAGGATGNSEDSDAAIADTLGLPAGASVTYTVTCTVASEATGALSNTATIASSTIFDPDTGNNSATDDNTALSRDFGDAPDPGYPTLLASNGAFHAIDPAFFLGAGVDGEADGQPNEGATGDDDADSADEDGVSFTSTLGLGATDSTASLDVTASAPGFLNAWVDFDADSSWDGSGEQVLIDESLAAGVNSLEVTVPSTAALGCTYSRFRFSTATGLSYDGEAPDGEVEDYAILVVPADEYEVINTEFVDTVVILALDLITAGGEFASPLPDVLVGGMADVTFHAENTIVLRNGFAVDELGTFRALLGAVPTATCP